MMRINTNLLWSLLLLSLIVELSSCYNEENQAEDSLIGIWKVTEIETRYPSDAPANGTEQGDLGSFSFEDNSVEYNFTRNDSLYSGTKPWNITAEKRPSGFVRVTVFTLTIENEFVFDVAFADQTRRSERNAEEATFIVEPPANEKGVFLRFVLEKES